MLNTTHTDARTHTSISHNIKNFSALTGMPAADPPVLWLGAGPTGVVINKAEMFCLFPFKYDFNETSLPHLTLLVLNYWGVLLPASFFLSLQFSDIQQQLRSDLRSASSSGLLMFFTSDFTKWRTQLSALRSHLIKFAQSTHAQTHRDYFAPESVTS